MAAFEDGAIGRAVAAASQPVGDPTLRDAAVVALENVAVTYDTYKHAQKNVKKFGKEYVAAAKQTYLDSKELSSQMQKLYEASKTTVNQSIPLQTQTIEEPGGFQGGYYAPVETPAPTPPAAPAISSPVVIVPVKTAPIDTILFDDDSVPIEIMSDLIFENIGGHELINIARNDIINGQTVLYQPIKNLSSIQQQYNPNNIVSLQNTSDKYFANFSIKLETKLPPEGSGPDAAYVYIEESTGDLIVELINLDPDEQIEVQISLSGTIYEAEFNES